jgi:tetratricopeptide (TPR) repeat protein
MKDEKLNKAKTSVKTVQLAKTKKKPAKKAAPANGKNTKLKKSLPRIAVAKKTAGKTVTPAYRGIKRTVAAKRTAVKVVSASRIVEKPVKHSANKTFTVTFANRIAKTPVKSAHMGVKKVTAQKKNAVKKPLKTAKDSHTAEKPAKPTVKKNSAASLAKETVKIPENISASKAINIAEDLKIKNTQVETALNSFEEPLKELPINAPEPSGEIKVGSPEESYLKDDAETITICHEPVSKVVKSEEVALKPSESTTSPDETLPLSKNEKFKEDIKDTVQTSQEPKDREITPSSRVLASDMKFKVPIVRQRKSGNAFLINALAVAVILLIVSAISFFGGKSDNSGSSSEIRKKLPDPVKNEALNKSLPVSLKQDQTALESRHSKAVEIARAGNQTEAIAQLKQLIDETGDRKAIYYDYIAVLSWNRQHEETLKAFNEISSQENIPSYVLSAVYNSYEQTGNQDGMSTISKRLGLPVTKDTTKAPLEEQKKEYADAPVTAKESSVVDQIISSRNSNESIKETGVELPGTDKKEDLDKDLSLKQDKQEQLLILENRRTDIYLQALSMTRNYAEIRKVLEREIESTEGENIIRLMRLAQYGIENNLRSVSLKAYEKVLRHDPENLTAKRNIAEILYAERKYEPALKYFREYNGKTGGDYITNYDQAELMYILRKSLEPEKADPFFEKAIEQAGLMGGGIKDAEIIRAKSFFRLGKRPEAISVFENLEKNHPDDIFIVVDFARMLYDLELIDEAFSKLKKLPENMYDPDCLNVYHLDKQQVDDIVIRVMTIRIAYELSQKKYFTVKKMLKELQEHYPDQPDAALSRAAFYSSFQNWRGELDSDKQALKNYPEDETLINEIDRLNRAHGSFVANEFGVRLSDNNGVELLNQTKMELRITDDIRLGINYTVDVARLHDVPTTDGTEKDFDGVRTQAEIFLQGDFINGDSARISFFEQDGIAGVGGWYKLLDYWGDTTLKGAWREPYWGQQQAIAEKGSNTYLQLGRVYRPFDSLTLSGSVSMNSYGLKESQDLARSVGVDAKAEYKLPQIELQKKWLGDLSVFTLNYEFNFENFYHHKTNSDGTRQYNPDDIQVHSFYLGYTNQFTADLSGTLSAGYAYDAVGGGPTSGPIYGASLNYLLTKKLELSANVGQVISSNKYFYAGLGLKYSFMPETVVELFNGSNKASEEK